MALEGNIVSEVVKLHCNRDMNACTKSDGNTSKNVTHIQTLELHGDATGEDVKVKSW